MPPSRSPFAPSSSTPGVGQIVLSLQPPDKQVLSTLTYQYPLKLIAPDAHKTEDGTHVKIVFLLTYGGGLVGGDAIRLTVLLEDHTRLTLLTQGSTKIFKSPNMSTVSQQTLDVKLGRGASLCYLPDPTQPYQESVYEQRQTFYVEPDGSSNLLMLDWVSEGRPARGESWTLWSWHGRNEVREYDEKSRGRLLLRDAVLLHEGSLGAGLVSKTNNLGVLGTLVVYGTLFSALSEFILHEFDEQPRIGAKSWATEAPNREAGSGASSRLAKETADGLLWTAARVRGFVLVKFGSSDVDGSRRWLGDLLRRQGTVEAEFGHQALQALR